MQCLVAIQGRRGAGAGWGRGSAGEGGSSGGVCPPSLIRPSQVVAVVMDMFTDVDLLGEVLEAAARRVPVYILLDEMNAQHFLDMADKCRVNLHHVDVSGRDGLGGRGKTPPSGT